MPRPGPPKIAVSVRMSPQQIDAVRDHGKHLITQGAVEEDEITSSDGKINVSAVVRASLRRAIVGYPA